MNVSGGEVTFSEGASTTANSNPRDKHAYNFTSIFPMANGGLELYHHAGRNKCHRI